jgi:hypothetical protein
MAEFSKVGVDRELRRCGFCPAGFCFNVKGSASVGGNDKIRFAWGAVGAVGCGAVEMSPSSPVAFRENLGV